MVHPNVSKSDNVQFKNAYDKSGLVIDIEDLEKQLVDRKQEFFCIGCRKPLRPRLGKIRTAHFYHLNSRACSYETYLHKLGKELFFEEFQKRKKEGRAFELEMPEEIVCTKYQNCGKTCKTKSTDSGKINLISNYPEIEIEKRMDDFIPDLVVYNTESNKHVFIEIVVTNAPSSEKLKAGIPIIQINAKSEEDFHFLKEGSISESFRQIKIHNFPINQVVVTECRDLCHIEDTEKAYYNSLVWIKDSFSYHKQNSLPFYLEFPRKYICSRFSEKFDTNCIYKEFMSNNIVHLYNAAKINVLNESAYLTLSHASDVSKDILIIGNNRKKPSKWRGAIIKILEGKLASQNTSKFLDCISGKSGLFHLVTYRKGQIEKDCRGTCKQKHQFFCIRKDMGAVLPEMTFSDSRLHNSTYPFIRLLDPSVIKDDKEKMYFQMVEASLKEGIPIRNCYVCRYHALNKNSNWKGKGPIFCKTYKKTCKSNEATGCDRYRPDLESIKVNYIGRNYF